MNETAKKSRIRSAFSSIYNTSPKKVVARTRKVQSPVYFTTKKVTVSVPVPHVRRSIVRLSSSRDMLSTAVEGSVLADKLFPVESRYSSWTAGNFGAATV